MISRIYFRHLPTLVYKLSKHIKAPCDCLELQEAITALYASSKKWLLELNIDKCKILSLARAFCIQLCNRTRWYP